LPTRLAFPLLVARTVRDLTPPALPSAAALGAQVTLQPDPRADTLQVRDPDGATTALPLASGAPVALALTQPGVYTLTELSGTTTLYSAPLPVNAGAPAESALGPRPLPNLTAPAVSAGASAAEARPQPLWPWFVALALAVLLFEWIYVHGARRAPQEV
jgi:hypothetical protein